MDFFSKYTTNFPQTTPPKNHNTGILGQDNDINGLEGILIVSIGVKEKPSTWEGNSYLIELINVF